MKRADVETTMAKAVERLGIPAHLIHIKKVPSRTEVSVVVGGERKVLKLRSGITQGEIDIQIARLENFLNERSGTVDIEEAIAGKVGA